MKSQRFWRGTTAKSPRPVEPDFSTVLLDKMKSDFEWKRNTKKPLSQDRLKRIVELSLTALERKFGPPF